MSEIKPPLKVSDLIDLGCDPQTAADWMVTRKGKRAGPLTETAWRRLVNEAKRAGITPKAAVAFCAEFGWIGFHADGYAEHVAKVRVPAARATEADRTQEYLASEHRPQTPEERQRASEARREAMRKLGRAH
jgi:hypothetical protein